ncbi:MAG: dimethyl sulfoxide reductase anchor subunit [Gammaproteobacteria bacterium]|nr:dimethyl sulfoxide reductase anchor subunit [Gammaproteobacteria bacterium]
MNPAASVLLLTTLTGFAYGLLAWIGGFAAAGVPPRSPGFAVVGVVIALMAASAGLFASMWHLGRKERAWRAFSQWRSSWLSREGVAAVLVYPIAAGFAAAAWFDFGGTAMRALGALTAVASLATVYCTAMIYASLKPIRQWHNPHTATDYLIFAIYSGAALYATLHALAFGHARRAAAITAAAAVIAWFAKQAYWRYVDGQTPLATLAAAIGLPESIEARPLDSPHFTENYILREMGFRVARRHAAKLRRLTLLIAFLLPFGFSMIASLTPWSLVACTLALAFAAVGMFVERWLFFAEATHVSALYYGRTI